MFESHQCNLYIVPNQENSCTETKMKPLSMMNLSCKNLFHNGCKINESKLKPTPRKSCPLNVMSQLHYVLETQCPRNIMFWLHYVPETSGTSYTIVPETSGSGYIMSLKHQGPATFCP